MGQVEPVEAADFYEQDGEVGAAWQGFLDARRAVAEVFGNGRSCSFKHGAGAGAGEVAAAAGGRGALPRGIGDWTAMFNAPFAAHADLDASLAAAEASAARCRSELQEQDVEIQRALRDFQRAEKSLAARTMTAAEFDTEKFEHDAAIARRLSLEAALQLAEARVQEAKQLRENMFVRAPFAGTVISRDAELGESIMPGGMGEASGRGSVVTLADLEHLEVDCDVKEDFISRVTQGQTAEVAVDAVPGRRYRGTVRKIIPMGDRARATVKVRVALVDADASLFPEMSCTVYFLSDEAKESAESEVSRVFCPNDAIQQAGSESYVWIVAAEDRLRRVVVQLGEKKEDRTEVTLGLQGGEKVVVSAPQDFRDGLVVRTAQ